MKCSKCATELDTPLEALLEMCSDCASELTKRDLELLKQAKGIKSTASH